MANAETRVSSISTNIWPIGRKSGETKRFFCCPNGKILRKTVFHRATLSLRKPNVELKGLFISVTHYVRTHNERFMLLSCFCEFLFVIRWFFFSCFALLALWKIHIKILIWVQCYSVCYLLLKNTLKLWVLLNYHHNCCRDIYSCSLSNLKK